MRRFVGILDTTVANFERIRTSVQTDACGKLRFFLLVGYEDYHIHTTLAQDVIVQQLRRKIIQHPMLTKTTIIFLYSDAIFVTSFAAFTPDKPAIQLLRSPK